MTRRVGLFLVAAALLAEAVTLPRKAGEFTIALNGGKKVALSDYKGKAVVLGFILTTCSHCQATTGILSRLQTEYGPRGLQVLESAIDQGAEAFVPRFIQTYQPAFPVGFNDYPAAQAFMQFVGAGAHKTAAGTAALRIHWHFNVSILSKFFGLVVAGIYVANDSHARICRQHALNPLRHHLCAIGDRDLPGVQRVANANPSAVISAPSLSPSPSRFPVKQIKFAIPRRAASTSLASTSLLMRSW